MIKSAEISDCGVYRSMLLRLWDEALPVLVVIMLNPSTADAEIDHIGDRLAGRAAPLAVQQLVDQRFHLVESGMHFADHIDAFADATRTTL